MKESEPKASPSIARTLGALALVVWVVWWIDALVELRLLGAEKTWITHAFFGADFWSQSELAARAFAAGGDPYEHPGGHLYHYPPLAIRLFLWVVPFSSHTALRIWIVVCAGILVLGTVVAHRTRARVGVEPVPLSVALAMVLFSFPAVFEMERGNFNVIALAAILAALPLLRKGGRRREILAACLLAIGPWVKLYPALLGLGLVGLRRFRVLGAFVVAGVAIGLATPVETLRSFGVLGRVVSANESWTNGSPYWPWSHSLSVLWLESIHFAPPGLADALARIPSVLVALGVVVPAIGVVCTRVARCKSPEPLTYPLLLWVIAVASCVPVVANDYSLVFLPLAAVAVWSRKDPPLVQAGLCLSLVWWQPIALPVHALVLLALKLCALASVGLCLTLRARSLGSDILSTEDR